MATLRHSSRPTATLPGRPVRPARFLCASHSPSRPRHVIEEAVALRDAAVAAAVGEFDSALRAPRPFTKLSAGLAGCRYNRGITQDCRTILGTHTGRGGCYLRLATGSRGGRPERIVIDGSQTNREAILACDTADRLCDRSQCKLKPIRIRQSAYLNNAIEQDHRAVKRRIRPILGFKSIDSARAILGGIEMVHMMRQGQAKYAGNRPLSLAEQFNILAA